MCHVKGEESDRLVYVDQIWILPKMGENDEGKI